MKSFSTKNSNSFFRGGKKPSKKKSSVSVSKKHNNGEVKVPPVIIDHKALK